MTRRQVPSKSSGRRMSSVGVACLNVPCPRNLRRRTIRTAFSPGPGRPASAVGAVAPCQGRDRAMVEERSRPEEPSPGPWQLWPPRGTRSGFLRVWRRDLSSARSTVSQQRRSDSASQSYQASPSEANPDSPPRCCPSPEISRIPRLFLFTGSYTACAQIPGAR